MFFKQSTNKNEDDGKQKENQALQHFTLGNATKDEGVKKLKARIDALCTRIRLLKERAEESEKFPKVELLEYEKTATSEKISDDNVLKKIEVDVDRFRESHLKYFLRLTPTEVNALLGFLPFDPKEIKQKFGYLPCRYAEKISKHAVEDTNVFWKKDEVGGKVFHTFTVVKDDIAQNNESSLTHIGDVIAKFKNKHPDDKSILLIPMRQCSRFLGDYVDLAPVSYWTGVNTKKEHIVLVEVDLEKKTMKVHDSSKDDYYWFFPHPLIKVASDNGLSYNPRKDYYLYGMQQDDCLCGYFVTEFIRSIHTIGNASQCPNIRLDQKSYVTNYVYIRKTWPEWGITEEEPVRQKLNLAKPN